MTNAGFSAHELEEWLHASIRQAEQRLPDLLDLPPAILRRELDTRPELCTAGMIHALTGVAAKSRAQLPLRAYELTAVVLDFAPRIPVTADRAVVVMRLEAMACREHARALSDLDRAAEARQALANARRLLLQTPAHDWYIATIDLAEAPLVYDEGDVEEALRLVESAAAEFALYHDYEHLVEAKLLEISMYTIAGNHLAADNAWTWTAALAQRRGHPTLLARLALTAARLHLRRDDAETASRLLDKAIRTFDAAGLKREATRARWHRAEAMTARGRLAEAISEYHIVRAGLLATGAITDAAIAGAEAVELLLVAGRDAEVPLLTESLVAAFRTRLTQNALEAFTWLDARANSGELTPADAAAVRRYFEDLPQRPLARFPGLD